MTVLIQNEKINRTTKLGEISKKVQERKLRIEMVGACDEKRIGLCENAGEGNRSAREKRMKVKRWLNRERRSRLSRRKV